MSLRIWTAGIAVTGLALYTLSLLPLSGQPLPASFEPEPNSAQAELPGATMVPLNFVDPSQIEFMPDDGDWDHSNGEADSLVPSTPTSITESERVRPIASAPVHTFHSHSNLEVLS